MIGVCGHGVKPDDAPSREAGSGWRHLVGGNGREYYWPLRKAVKRSAAVSPGQDQIGRMFDADEAQKGLVSTSRMNAAPLSQDSRASSAEGSTASSPTRTR